MSFRVDAMQNDIALMLFYVTEVILIIPAKAPSVSLTRHRQIFTSN